MKYWLITLKEQNVFLRFLANRKEDDMLIVLYPEGEDKISLALINHIKKARCGVEFIECKKYGSSCDVGIAYVVGKLSGKYENITCLSEDAAVARFFDKPVRRKKAAVAVSPETDPITDIKKAKNSTPTDHPVEDIPAEDNKDTNARKTRGPKGKNQEKPSDNDEFEKAYNDFEVFLKNHKTKQFDPSQHIGTILRAAKNAKKENTLLSDELKIWCRKTVADHLLMIFGDELDKIADYASKIRD